MRAFERALSGKELLRWPSSRVSCASCMVLSGLYSRSVSSQMKKWDGAEGRERNYEDIFQHSFYALSHCFFYRTPEHSRNNLHTANTSTEQCPHSTRG